MRHIPIAALAVTLVLAFGPVVPGPVRAASPSRASAGTDTAARDLAKLRAGQGLGPLVQDPILARAAREQADAMARSATMSHDVAGSLQTRLSRAGIRASRAAENVAAGYGSLSEVLAGWMTSPGHRDNIMMREATRFGIARAEGRGGPYWALVLASPEPKVPGPMPNAARGSVNFMGLELPLRP